MSEATNREQTMGAQFREALQVLQKMESDEASVIEAQAVARTIATNLLIHAGKFDANEAEVKAMQKKVVLCFGDCVDEESPNLRDFHELIREADLARIGGA